MNGTVAGGGKHPQVFKDLGANAWIIRARGIPGDSLQHEGHLLKGYRPEN